MGAQEQGADATQGRWLVIPRTLCLVRHGNDLLLLKRGAHKRVFPNKYNGLGGHIERGESPTAGAIREIKEESGLDVHNIRLRGIIHIDAGHSNGIMLFVYTAESLSREFIDSEEGRLEWVPLIEIQNKDLVEDLYILIPHLFESEELFSAHVHYDEQDRMVFQFT
jgi:8-oxo-dGTP diphosphatase